MYCRIGPVKLWLIIGDWIGVCIGDFFGLCRLVSVLVCILVYVLMYVLVYVLVFVLVYCIITYNIKTGGVEEDSRGDGLHGRYKRDSSL